MCEGATSAVDKTGTVLVAFTSSRKSQVKSEAKSERKFETTSNAPAPTPKVKKNDEKKNDEVKEPVAKAA